MPHNVKNQSLCYSRISDIGLSIEANSWSAVLLVLQVSVMVLNVFLNGTLCFRLFRLKSASRRPSHVLILHQAILNLLIAGFCQSTVVMKLVPWNVIDLVKLCRFSTTSFTILRAASVWTIVLLSIDRYRFIVTFSTYKNGTTFTVMNLSLLFTWIPPLVFGLSPLSVVLKTSNPCWERCLCSLVLCPDASVLSGIFYFLYTVVFCILPCLILVRMYYPVYSKAKEHHARRLQSSNSRLQLGRMNNNQSGITTQRVAESQPPLKAGRVLLLAMSFYLICFTPYFVSIILLVLGVWPEGSSTPPNVLIFFEVLLFMHTLFDPFLNGFGTSHIKRGICLCPCWKTEASTIEPFVAGPQPEARSSVSHISRNVAGSSLSLFSGEDLVSRDFLEIYKNRHTPADDAEPEGRRQSWRYPSGWQAWTGPNVHQSLTTSSHRSGKKQPIRSHVLKTIGETAVALAFPNISPPTTEERQTQRVSRIHAVMFPNRATSDDKFNTLNHSCGHH